MDLRIDTPARIILLGPSMCGKSSWLVNVLKNQEHCFKQTFDHIFFCNGVPQEKLEKDLTAFFGSKNITFFKKYFPETEIESGTLFKGTHNPVIVIDDLASETSNSKTLSNLFTRISHHAPVTVILTTQVLFTRGGSMHDASRNASHFAIFRAPREGQGIRIMVCLYCFTPFLDSFNIFCFLFQARQMFPGNSKLMIDAYEKCIEEPYSCLVVDASPNCHHLFRLRAGIHSPDSDYSIFAPENAELPI